jgi:hypothetical protein
MKAPHSDPCHYPFHPRIMRLNKAEIETEVDRQFMGEWRPTAPPCSLLYSPTRSPITTIAVSLVSSTVPSLRFTGLIVSSTCPHSKRVCDLVVGVKSRAIVVLGCASPGRTDLVLVEMLSVLWLTAVTR